MCECSKQYNGFAKVRNCYKTNSDTIITASACAKAIGNTKEHAYQNAKKKANMIAILTAKQKADTLNQTIVSQIDCRNYQKIVYYHNIDNEETTTIINTSPVYAKYVTTFDIYSDRSLTNKIGNMKVDKDVFELSPHSSDGIGPKTQAIYRHIIEFDPLYNPDGSVVFCLNLESRGLTDYGMHDTPGPYFGPINGLQSSGKYSNCRGVFKKFVPPNNPTDVRIVKWTLYIYK